MRGASRDLRLYVSLSLCVVLGFITCFNVPVLDFRRLASNLFFTVYMSTVIFTVYMLHIPQYVIICN